MLEFCWTIYEMAPVFSRPRAVCLPDDVLRIIAAILPVTDLTNMIRSCRVFHAAGSPVLYRSVESWFDPISSVRARAANNRPIELLLTIIKSSLPTRSSSVPSRCYAAHIVTLSYGSWSLEADFRALPLLAEALRFTRKLRHLRIDLGPHSIPIALDVFRRSSIIITPSTPLALSSPADELSLPCLQSVRTSRIAVAEALMSYRRIKTVTVDMALHEQALAKFLRIGVPWDSTHLRQLSLSVGTFSPCVVVVHGIFAAFPRLEHLALRVAGGFASEYMKDAVEILAELPEVARFLRTLAINHGGFEKHTAALQELRSAIDDGCSRRPALREVALGASMWTRENEYAEWTFVPSVRAGHWAWVMHKSKGEWGRSAQAIKAYQPRSFY